MKRTQFGFALVGLFVVGLAGCPEPTTKKSRNNDDAEAPPEGMGGKAAGMGGRPAGNGGAVVGNGGSTGTGNGGTTGNGGSVGSGNGGAIGSGNGGAKMDMGMGAGGAKGDMGGGSDMKAGDMKPAGAVSYKTDVWPILMKNCKTCHMGGMGIAGLGEMGAYDYLQMNHTGMCDGKTVKRCVSLQYKLDPASVIVCGNKMPKGTMGVMDAAAIATLKAWATAGCPM